MKNIINKYLRKLGAEVHGVGYIEKLKNSSTEKNEWNKQVELLKGQAKTIIDVGANRGDTTTIYRTKFPNATVHAFEPFQQSYAIFEGIHGADKNVILNKVGLADAQGVAKFNVNHSVDTNSLLESKSLGATSDKSCATESQIEILISTLDIYCQQAGIDNIDILKIDVQGAEIKVLQGALQLLQQKKIKLIYTEAYFVQQYVNQPFFHEIASFLYQHNFTLQDIYDPYYNTENILWCDAMFILNDLQK